MRAVHSARDLEAILQDLAPIFEGKETEHNWKSRDNCCNDLRKLAIESDAPKDYHHVFVLGIKTLLDGIVSCVISERTTLSNHACDLVQALAKTLGPSIHSMLDILMPATVRLCAAARKISSKAGNSTISEIIASSRTYTPRLLNHVASACTDKNDAPRVYAAAWLALLIQLYGHQIEQTGGLPILERSLKLGLNDPHLEARDNARSTYWRFASLWPQRAEEIMSSLDPQKQKALQDHSSNPDKISKQTEKSSRGSALAEMRAQAKRDLVAKRAATPTDEPPLVVGIDSGQIGLGGQPQEKRKHGIKSKPEVQHISSSTRQQQPLQPIRNPASLESLAAHLDPANHSSNTTTKTHEPQKSSDSTSSERSRPLMAAPVRRAVRVVSKSALPPRPASREEQMPIRDVKPPTPATRSVSRDDHISSRDHKPPTPSMRSAPREDHQIHQDVKAPTPIIRPMSRNGQPPTKDLKSQIQSLRPTSNEPRVPMKDVRSPINTMSVETKTWVSPPIKQSKSFDARSKNVSKYEAIEDTLYAHHQSAVRRDSSDSQAQLQLQSCLKRVRKGDLSILGFGKLRRLIEGHGNRLLADDRHFQEVMQSLLDGADSTSSTESRFALLSVLRAVLSANEMASRPFRPRVMTLLLKSRKCVDDQDYKVSGLEETAHEIITHCDSIPLIVKAILEVLEALDSDLPAKSDTRTMIFGTQCLGSLFTKAMSSNIETQPLETHIDRSVTLATRCMHTFDPRVRHATVELCVVLQQMMGEGRFEQAFGAEERTMNMVAYYASRTPASGMELGVH